MDNTKDAEDIATLIHRENMPLIRAAVAAALKRKPTDSELNLSSAGFYMGAMMAIKFMRESTDKEMSKKK